MSDCIEDAVATGAKVGGIMAVSAGVLGIIGGVIGAPVTGGGSLTLAAAGVGAVSGAGAAGVRSAMGKPCRSPALEGIDKATGYIKSAGEEIVKLA